MCLPAHVTAGTHMSTVRIQWARALVREFMRKKKRSGDLQGTQFPAEDLTQLGHYENAAAVAKSAQNITKWFQAVRDGEQPAFPLNVLYINTTFRELTGKLFDNYNSGLVESPTFMVPAGSIKFAEKDTDLAVFQTFLKANDMELALYVAESVYQIGDTTMQLGAINIKFVEGYVWTEA